MDKNIDEITEMAFELMHYAKAVHILIENTADNNDDPAYILPVSKLLHEKSEEVFAAIENYEFELIKTKPLPELQT